MTKPMRLNLVYDDEHFSLDLPPGELRVANVVMPIATPKSLFLVLGLLKEGSPDPEVLGIYVVTHDAARIFLKKMDEIRQARPSWFVAPH